MTNLFSSFTFFSILKESIKLVPKNGKLMLFIALSTILLCWTFTALFFHLIEYLAFDMIPNLLPGPQSFNPQDPATFMPQPGLNPPSLNPNLRRDLALLILVQIAFNIATSVVFFVSGISTITVSAASYSAKSLSFKELFSCIWRTWKRPFITSFYVTLFSLGFLFVFTMPLFPLVLYYTPTTLAIAIVFGIFWLGLYLYMYVVWGLALVVSVVEETPSGVDAVVKAGELVKGKRLHGFLLNVAGVVLLTIAEGSVLGLGSRIKWLKNHEMVHGLLLAGPVYLGVIFIAVAYTVLYFQCRKIHGEEVELHGTVLYTKLQVTGSR